MKILNLIFSLLIVSTIVLSSCRGNEELFPNELTIGEQTWMSKNLNVDKFRNGDPILYAKTNEEWKEATNNKQAAYCYYKNKTDSGEFYGKLYNWYAVNDSRGLAPEGWRIPTNEDWKNFNNYFRGESFDGQKKQTQFYKFLPEGFRGGNGSFSEFGMTGFSKWWSSSEPSSYDIFMFEHDGNNGYINGRNYFLIGGGFSIRCLKELSNIKPSQKLETFSNKITLGKQVWMSENLNVDKFRNGDPILHAKTDEEWNIASENKQPAWCYYKNNPDNGDRYGKLYNWYATNDSRGLAPLGWRVPTHEDWIHLIDFLGGEKIAGKKMKSLKYWASQSTEFVPADDYTDYQTNKSNEVGFIGLPGGIRGNDKFTEINYIGLWWSSSEASSINYNEAPTEAHPNDIKENHSYGGTNAWCLQLYYNQRHAFTVEQKKLVGCSVRCIKD